MTQSQAILLAMIPASYVLGSIPFGLMVGLAKGVDPRRAGSGNIGASNVGRLLGGRFFAVVFILDLFKGMIPMVAAGLVLPEGQRGQLEYVLWILVGFAAIAGHMFSLFLRFQGGKGVATSAGVVLGLFPYYTLPGLIAMLAWLILLRMMRFISVASIGASIVFPLAYLAISLARDWPVFHEQLPLLVFALIVPGMIIYKHRGNVARLRAGTEHRV